MKAENYFVYMDSDCLTYNTYPFLTIFPASRSADLIYLVLKTLETRSIFNTQQIGDAIDIRYSTNRRRHWYSIPTRLRRDCCLILNKLETQSIFYTQQQSCERKRWLDLLSTWYSVNHRRHRTSVKRIHGDAIDIRYSTILWEVLAEALIRSTRYSRDFNGDAIDQFSILKVSTESRRRNRYSILIKRRRGQYSILNRWRRD